GGHRSDLRHARRRGRGGRGLPAPPRPAARPRPLSGAAPAPPRRPARPTPRRPAAAVVHTVHNPLGPHPVDNPVSLWTTLVIAGGGVWMNLWKLWRTTRM